jgi:hypothetical protein
MLFFDFYNGDSETSRASNFLPADPKLGKQLTMTGRERTLKSTQSWKRRQAVTDTSDSIGSRELALKALAQGETLADAAGNSRLTARQLRFHASKAAMVDALADDFALFGGNALPRRADRSLPIVTHQLALQLTLDHPDHGLRSIVNMCETMNARISVASLSRLLRRTGLAKAEQRVCAAEMIKQAAAKPAIWLVFVGSLQVDKGANFSNLLLAVHEASGFVWGEVATGYDAEALSALVLGQVKPAMLAQGISAFTVKTSLVSDISSVDTGTDRYVDTSTIIPDLEDVRPLWGANGVALQCGASAKSFSAIAAASVTLSRQMQFNAKAQYPSLKYFSTHDAAADYLADRIADWNSTPHLEQPCLGFSPAEVLARRSQETQ